MNTSAHLAKHFRDFHQGVNWTWSNMKDNLSDVTWQEATTQLYDLNTIAVLAYHINYYVGAALKVLEGGPLDAHDDYAFDVPPIRSQEDWAQLLTGFWDNAERFADLVEQLPPERLSETFVEEKYGTYYRNIAGIIEHGHYHLGQIALIKKLIRQGEKAGE